jgi:hypothetical protein
MEPKYQQAAAAGAPIDVRAVDTIINYHRHLDSRLTHAIVSNQVGTMGLPVSTISLFPTLAKTIKSRLQNSTPPVPSGNKRAAATAQPSPSDNHSKQAKADAGTTPANNDRAKAMGMLKLVPPVTAPPKANHITWGNDTKSICMYFATQNFACTNKKCRKWAIFPPLLDKCSPIG